MMETNLVLCGFAASNFYNKVKFALLEKQLNFEERRSYPWEEPRCADLTPLGKVPYLLTPDGPLSESQAILEYLEQAYPEPALYAAAPYARAKQRELIAFVELYIEWVARRLYPEAFFGLTLSAANKADVHTLLTRNLAALAHLLRFAPYAGGPTFSAVDCALWPHFGVVSLCCRKIYGEDLVARALPGVGDYLALIAARAHAQRILQDRQNANAEFAAAMQRRTAGG